MQRSAYFLTAIIGACLYAATSFAQSFHEPERGSPERAAILDALRPAVEAEMRGPVEFVILMMRASPEWAFVQADPRRPGGAPIDAAETGFADDAEFMDGLTVYGLARLQAGRWTLVDHLVGPTDVGHIAWQQRYGVPLVILGLENLQ